MYKYKNRYFKCLKVEKHTSKQSKYLVKRYRKFLFFYIKTKNPAVWIPEFEFKQFKRIERRVKNE